MTNIFSVVLLFSYYYTSGKMYSLCNLYSYIVK